MIVLMAVAVISTTGVATAAKKDAPYQIYYTGKDMKWGGGQCNQRFVYVALGTTATHTESAKGNRATMSMTATEGQTGYQAAMLGVKWDWVGGITYDNYVQYSPKFVKVTVDATWNIEVSGGDPDTQITYFFVGQDKQVITGTGSSLSMGQRHTSVR